MNYFYISCVFFCFFFLLVDKQRCPILQEDNELRLVPGDELRLRYSGDAAHPAWQSVGHVVCMDFIFLQFSSINKTQSLVFLIFTYHHYAVRKTVDLLLVKKWANKHNEYNCFQIMKLVLNLSLQKPLVSHTQIQSSFNHCSLPIISIFRCKGSTIDCYMLLFYCSLVQCMHATYME